METDATATACRGGTAPRRGVGLAEMAARCYAVCVLKCSQDQDRRQPQSQLFLNMTLDLTSNCMGVCKARQPDAYVC